jgi:hypothetical protein
MLDLIALSLSAISLAASGYAIYITKKDGFTAVMNRSLTNVSRNIFGRNISGRNLSGTPVEKVLSKDERRDLIRERSHDPAIAKIIKDQIEVIKNKSQLIPSDCEAQTNLPAFRERQIRRQNTTWQTPEGR